MMVKYNIYRYLGRNGIITSRVLLDGINHIPLMELRADQGKKLTNGEKITQSVIVELDEVNNWHEIDDIGQE